MIKFLLLFLVFTVASAPAYSKLYVWKCVNCECYFYGKNPPQNSECLHKGFYNIWRLERIIDVPLTKKERDELG
jgi:hypothetical protein